MSSDSLRLASSLKNEELWKDSNALEVYGKGPKNFNKAKLVVEDERQEE